MRLPKRSAVWATALIGVGSLVSGLSQSAGAGPLALASEMNSRASLTCSLATLHGTYSFAAESVQVSPPDAGPFAYAGFVTYDGKGHGSEIYTISVNGVVSRGVRETNTYTVSPDCIESEVDTGKDGIGTQHYDGYLSPDGNQMMFIQTDAGVVSAGTLIRVVNPEREGKSAGGERQ